MSASRRIANRLGLSLAMSLLVLGSASAGDVTVYERAPSVDELQRQLTGAAPDTNVDAGTKRKVRTRAIVFGDPAPAEAPPAAAVPAQPMPTPAAYAPPVPAAPQPAVAAAAPAPQTPKVSDRAIAFPITFKVNSAAILPESSPFIESIAGLLLRDPNLRLMIEGHTDVSGNSARNIALSRERAFSVMNYLIDHFQIEPVRMVPVGKGSSEPLRGMDPTDPKNRRVQFRVVG